MLAPLLLAGCEEPPRTTASTSITYIARDLTGGYFDLSAHAGRVVLLNAWATWCAPCREEMPALERVHGTYGARGLDVVGVSVDAADADADVRAFVRHLNITYTIARDPERVIADTFDTIGLPQTILIARDGTIAHQWRGAFDPLGEDARVRIERALDGTA